MSATGSARPVVLGGSPTWKPRGPVQWDRWGGTAPSWSVEANWGNPNAITWPQRWPEDVRGVAEVAAGTWAHVGPRERAAEQRLAERMGLPHVFMSGSGTLALGVMYSVLMKARQRADKLPIGTPEVIMPAETFSATASMAALCGLKPVLVDVDPDTLVPTPDAIRSAITPNTVGIVAVALYATCPPLDEYRRIADEHDLFLALDAAHAPYGSYMGRPFAHWVDIGICSFQYGKVLTSGEGGAVFTVDPLLAALASLTIIGKKPDKRPEWWPGEDLDADVRAWGLQPYNLRYAEPQAALLLSQDQIYDAQQAHREEQYRRFLAGLASSGLPFTPLRSAGERVLYKVGLYNGTGVPTEALRLAFRLQVTGECNAPYLPLSDPASGFNPASAPWQFGHLGIAANPAEHPSTYSAVERLLMLSHDFFLRRDAAEHALEALSVLARNEGGLVDWANRS
jgi:dTDP-4-amino-4,6-dideoxygalactose transaminase